MTIKPLPNFQGFDWDEGNSGKNLETHGITDSECEAVFFNSPLLVVNDAKHSDLEIRFATFGLTNENRFVMLVFTMRANFIRVISARDMNRREKAWYKNYEKDAEI